ncbi:hypothetical protein [Methanobrevibacter sp.]|uniref:hypothetical protein n=1 Tax=Methanobrevibacter sp. TaxID=66852 RepID=UPI0026DF237B|nr:hypothetical protein [Methanobrevibacter sp.]MDO5859119.1 hypothetical protein [Methanobrevibacter sp.]
MNTKKILAITIIVLAVFSCLSVVSAGWFDFLGGEKHLEGDGSQITVPGNYTLDDKKLVASCGDINVTFTPQLKTDDKFEDEFFGAVKTKGNESGYENVTNKTVNGYTVHEFAAHPDKLKNMTVSTEVEGSDEAWIEFPPEIAAPFTDPVDHFRSVTFIKDGKEHKLLIFTNNATTNLYTSEIDGIIDSIAPLEK